MMMLASVLFLFLLISIILISLLASKLSLVKAKCLSHPTNVLALTIIVITLVACASIVNVVSDVTLFWSLVSSHQLLVGCTHRRTTITVHLFCS